jgi:hypothetical protein
MRINKRRTISVILLIVMLTLNFLPLSQAVKSEPHIVTFKMPEGHYYLQSAYIYRPDDSEVYLSELTLVVAHGHVLTEEEVAPFTHHCFDYAIDCHKYCRVTMTGWDINPVGITVTEDMTFTAVMNEDVCNVKVTMSKGEYTTFLPDKKTKYQSIELLVDKGYVLTEDDVERFMQVYCGVPNPGWKPGYVITGFDKDPLGFEVTEDVEFTAIGERLIHISLYIPDKEGVYHCQHGICIDVIEGSALPREELPDIANYVHDPDVVIAYWDVTDEQLAAIYPDNEFGACFNIYGVLFWRGDANMDKKVNTGDAVFILKNVANLVGLADDRLLTADMNNDGEVNTGDATAILTYIVRAA